MGHSSRGRNAVMTDGQKKDAIRRAWRMEEVEEVPFLIEVGEPIRATRSFLEDIPADLQRQVDYCQAVSAVGDYFIPNLKPNLGIGVVAAAFGCPWIADPRGDPWVRPLLDDATYSRVYELEIPDPGRSGLNSMALDRIDYFQQHSRLPARLVNVPSPTVTASLIWEYSSFISAMAEHPDEAHALLAKVTQATIDFITLELQRIRPDRLFALTHEPWYLPVDLGIRISDDTAAVMSPDTYREFCLPYNTAISNAFGGLVVHSCGSIEHVIPTILEIPGLRGIDLVATQNDWDAVRRMTRDRVPVCLRYYSWDFPNPESVDLPGYTRRLIDTFGRRGVLLWSQARTRSEAAALSRELRGMLRP